MSATITSPQYSAAGSNTWQIFGAANVTVTSACTHGSNGSRRRRVRAARQIDGDDRNAQLGDARG